ncbi:hypothetical protein BHE74_00001338 [Ensete ventricosum]|nr:hypothetical protein BHE74_00001338 [Ensete ventricosum]
MERCHLLVEHNSSTATHNYRSPSLRLALDAEPRNLALLKKQAIVEADVVPHPFFFFPDIDQFILTNKDRNKSITFHEVGRRRPPADVRQRHGLLLRQRVRQLPHHLEHSDGSPRWGNPVGRAGDEGEPVRGGPADGDRVDGVLEAAEAEDVDFVLVLDLAGVVLAGDIHRDDPRVGAPAKGQEAGGEGEESRFRGQEEAMGAVRISD